MFPVDPNTIYAFDDLDQLLGSCGLSRRWLLDQVRPRKLSRSAVLGSELLEALRSYSQERGQDAVADVAGRAPAVDGPRKRGRPRKAEFQPLDLSKYEK